MKKSIYGMAFIALLLIPGILVSQKPGKESVQHQKVTVSVKQGDSTVKRDLDVVYNPTQAKREGPPDYVPYDQAPEALNQEQPKYPELAIRAGLEGTVWIKLWVDTAGRVVQAYVQKSDAQIFEQSAIDAARQWRFKPAMMKGNPIATWVSVPFRFKIAGNPMEKRHVFDPTPTNTIFGRWNESQIIAWLIYVACILWIGLTLRAVKDVVQSHFPEQNDKLVWTIISIFIPIFGAILYFILGKKQKLQQDATR